MDLLANLVPVTLGNIVGGGILVALVYWLIYLRKDREAESEVRRKTSPRSSG